MAVVKKKTVGQKDKVKLVKVNHIVNHSIGGNQKKTIKIEDISGIVVEKVQSIAKRRIGSTKVVLPNGEVIIVRPGETIKVHAIGGSPKAKKNNVVDANVAASRHHLIKNTRFPVSKSKTVVAEAKKTKTPNTRALSKKQTLTFKSDEIIELYRSSPEFRKIAESGRYIYTDGKIVFYDNESLLISDDGLTLHPSNLAMLDPQKHLLTATKKQRQTPKFRHSDKYVELYKNGIISSFYSSVHDRLHISTTGGNGDDLIPIDKNLRDDDGGEDSNNPNGNTFEWDITAHEELEKLIKDQAKLKHTSLAKVAESLGIVKDTISRFWTEVDSRPELGTVIAVCLALNMSPRNSKRVIELCGYSLRDTPLERTYEFLIDFCYNRDMKTCNDVLTFAGHHPIPLTSTVFIDNE